MNQGATLKIQNKANVGKASVLHFLEITKQSQFPIFQSKIEPRKSKITKQTQLSYKSCLSCQKYCFIKTKPNWTEGKSSATPGKGGSIFHCFL
jgi:hypothetical protein